MPIVPVRGLGSVGIITDVPPTDLPLNAWSDGRNVRFNQGRVERSPIFRTYAKDGLIGFVTTTFNLDKLVFIHGLYNQGSFDSMILGMLNGRLYQLANGNLTNVNVGHVDATSSKPYTSCTLSGCTYINRADAVPRVLLPVGGVFGDLPAWTSTWRCEALRAFGSQLVALNVTKGATNFPLMVKISDVATYGSAPTSWDQTDTTKLSVENTLSQARTQIVDGLALGNDFIVYTHDEVWKVVNVGGQFLFDFLRLPFDNVGLINQNCMVEVNGKHYAWSETDIYVHDGVGKQSISDQRVRETFFRSVNMSKSNVFFTAHDKSHNEVLFCCISSNGQHVSDATYCNYAAVYNYQNNTWSFRDLPNVSSSSTANTNTVYTWTSVPSTLTWDTVGGSWADQEDSFSRSCVFAVVANSAMGITGTDRIDVLDFADKGRLTLPVDAAAAANPIAWVQRDGLHFDEAGLDVRSYKHMRSVTVMGSTINNDTAIQVRLSGGLTSFTPTLESWEYELGDPELELVLFDDYKHDTRIGGRYITVYFDCPTPNDFSLDGYDADMVRTGGR